MVSANPRVRTPEALLTRFRSRQFHLVRELLFSWIKPTILGCDSAHLGIQEGDIVCYALPFRSIADLMVVDKACADAGMPRPYLSMAIADEARSFFFLARPEGRLGRKSSRRQSARLLRLLALPVTSTPVKIIPVSLFWGHQPDQEKSWFKLILSENWSVTGSFRKLLAIVFHPNHILVQYAEPLLLSELQREQPDPSLQARKLVRMLRTHFNHQKQAILGPDLSHRRTLINSILDGVPVREAIEREAARSAISEQRVEKKAVAYANEIVSDQSYRVIRLFHIILTWLWNKLYDGIEVHNIDVVKDLARSHEIVYTPCHRSHIDYLLLSYVLYHNGLTPPHIAAGRNLNLPLIGPLLRRAGAFFMRRSFQGDVLYKAVFDEYLHLMFVRGYSVEYFIEGGRSRTGRMLTPRTGLLSMTLRSFERDASRPLALMPVYFSYQRIIEAPTYVSELAGKTKKQETIFDVFKVFSAFKNPFGKVAVSFGEAVLLKDFLDAELPQWSTGPATETRSFSEVCVRLARQLTSRINAAVVLNPVNLVATALLCTPRQTMEDSRLRNQIQALRQIATVTNTIVTALPPAAVIAEAERVAGVERLQKPFGDILFASPATTVLLSYYRNNTVHIFALPSLIARMLRTRGRCSRQDITDECTALYPFIQAEFFLPWHESDLDRICCRYIDLFARLELVAVSGDRLDPPDPTSEQFVCLSELAEVIEPTLERFFIVATLLDQRRETNLKEIEANAAATAQQLSAIYGINSPEFFDRSLFSTFIASLRQRQMVATDGTSVVVGEAFSPVRQITEATLDPDVRYNVRQAVSNLSRAASRRPAE